MKETILLKQNEVAQIAERMKASASVVAFKYQGLTVDKFQELRKEMRANGCEVEVLKNNISRRACKECGYAKEETMVIGDRIYTDIKSGLNAGVTGVLVMSGETTQEILDASVEKPHIVLKDAGEMIATI